VSEKNLSEAPVALVTGARRGIGKQLCHHLLEKGYVVVGCSLNPCEWEAPGFHSEVCDVSDEAGVKKLVRSIQKRFGRLDVLLNNAGAASMNHIFLMPLETARRITDTNLLGTFVVGREAAKLMRRRKYGRIVNFGSSAVAIRLAGEAMYVASKAAVVAFSQTMAREVGEFGITVNVVGPSPTATDMIRGVPNDKIQAFVDALPVPRLTTFEDISNVVDFFLLDSSEAVTGQVIYLNGMPNIG
jgi:3-oxoacyl-[acyl-carrier protein] reductase